MISTDVNALQPTSDLPPNAPIIFAKLEFRVPPSQREDFELARVGDIAVDRSGNIFVLDASDQSIKMFDAFGKPVRVFGRKGAGPGEFLAAASVVVLRDSIWIVDRRNDRITAFPIKGPGVRSFLLPTVGVGKTHVSAVAADGYVVIKETANPLGNASSNQRALVRMDARGTELNTIFGGLAKERSLVYTAVQTRNPSNVWRGYHPQPFAHYPIAVPSDQATSMVLVGTLMERGRETDKLRMIKVGLHGDTIWKRDLSYHAEPIRANDVTRIIDSLAREEVVIRGATFKPNRQMIDDSLQRAVYWPPTAGLMAGLDGAIWLKQRRPASSSKSRYWRLSSSGDFETIVEFPSGFRPLVASSLFVWGWSSDRDGIPFIERYRFSSRQ